MKTTIHITIMYLLTISTLNLFSGDKPQPNKKYQRSRMNACNNIKKMPKKQINPTENKLKSNNSDFENPLMAIGNMNIQNNQTEIVNLLTAFLTNNQNY